MSHTFIVSRFVLFLLIAISFTGCALNSHLTIPAGQEFVLGGNGNGKFRTQLENTGDWPVVIVSETEEGLTQVVDTLYPGARTKARFPRGAAAILTNSSHDATARLKVHVTGSLQLGMVYQESMQ